MIYTPWFIYLDLCTMIYVPGFMYADLCTFVFMNLAHLIKQDVIYIHIQTHPFLPHLSPKQRKFLRLYIYEVSYKC